MATTFRSFLSRWGRTAIPPNFRARLMLQPLEERAVPTYTVSNTSDSGAGSLRAAMTSANSTPATIDATGVTGTISLLSALPAITNSYTINGPTGTLAVDGNGGSYGIFYIYNGSSLLTVNLNHLTISNGSVSGGGAGVYDNGENLTLSYCKVTSNTATSGDGGGVYITNAPSVTIDNCTLTKNSAGSGNGGGMAINDPGNVNGSVSISLSTFGTIGNINTAKIGGGIYLASMADTVTINTSTIEGNTATTDGGGGIAIGDTPHLTIKNSLLNANSASSGYGGGIYYSKSVANGTTYNVHNSTIANNTALRGGGIFVDGQSLGTTEIHVYNSTIAYNTATETGPVYDGGGIGFLNFKSGDSVVLESTIVALNNTFNTATDSGPDIGGNLSGSVTAIHCLIGVADDGGWTLSGSSTINYNGTLLFPQDPGFLTPGTLAKNGGPTQTLALASNSKAVDHGDNPLSLSYDQRGPADISDVGNHYRVQGSAADIGAFEYDVFDDG